MIELLDQLGAVLGDHPRKGDGRFGWPALEVTGDFQNLFRLHAGVP